MSTQKEIAPLSGTAVAEFAQDQLNTFVADAVAVGLRSTPKWLPAWLFYDAEGSRLFERITELPEYYPTRTERAIFQQHAAAILDRALETYTACQGGTDGRIRVLELGSGSASKTGVLLAEAVRRQGRTEYLPVDVSEEAMEEAGRNLARVAPEVHVSPQLANYVTEALDVPPHAGPTLALYIGSSVGNFSPDEASAILQNLRAQLQPGDCLLLGTDLVKEPSLLVAAYDDAQGVTAAFNLNMLRRINRDLHANFDLAAFRHQAIWNATESRMEMHLQSSKAQTVYIPGAGITVPLAAGETIHTENSYKFTPASIAALLRSSGFTPVQTWNDERKWFAVTLAALAA